MISSRSNRISGSPADTHSPTWRFTSTTSASFRRGDRVFHDKFGYGTVTAVDDDRCEVAFEKSDTKRLLDRFLKPASEA